MRQVQPHDNIAVAKRNSEPRLLEVEGAKELPMRLESSWFVFFCFQEEKDGKL
jgi:hypothetical protein